MSCRTSSLHHICARGADVPRGRRRRAAWRSRRAPFSSEVVTLAGHTDDVSFVAAAPDGRVLTGSMRQDRRVGVAFSALVSNHPGAQTGSWRSWRCCRAEPSLRQRLGRRHREAVDARRHLERTVEVRSIVICVAALPDGIHIVVGASQQGGPAVPRRRDARPRLRGAHQGGHAVAVTADGQHIISRSADKASRCGALPARAS